MPFTSETLDLVDKVARILAYVAGAAWVYFNFFKARTYRPRIENSVKGELCRRASLEMVHVVVHVKNVGRGKVDIAQRGTGVRILSFDQSETNGWRHVATLPILTRHLWIEPNETVEDHAVWPLPLAKIAAVKVELVLRGKRWMSEAATILT